MEGFKEGNNVFSIKDSVKKHIDIIPQIMSMHAMTGCDSAPRTLWLLVTMEKALALQTTCNFFSLSTDNQLLASIFDNHLLNHCEQQSSC